MAVTGVDIGVKNLKAQSISSDRFAAGQLLQYAPSCKLRHTLQTGQLDVLIRDLRAPHLVNLLLKHEAGENEVLYRHFTP